MNYIALLSLVLLTISCASRPRPIVIAHRGASAYLPEHTLEAYSMAHAWGVDYIEADVVVTKDNQLIVLHDPHVDSTTNVAQLYPKRKRADGRYYAVDFTLEEIKKLSVSERKNLATGKQVFPARFPIHHSKFEVPTFKEYVELVQGLNQSTGRNVGLYVELKNPEFHQENGKDIAKLTLDFLKAQGLTKQESKIILQCFYPPTLRRIREEFKFELPLVLLLAQNDWKESSVDYQRLQKDEGLREVSQYVDGIGPYWPQLIELKDGKLQASPLMALAQKHNLQVHFYTHRPEEVAPAFASDKDFFKFFFEEVRVDGVFSDAPDKVIDFLRSN